MTSQIREEWLVQKLKELSSQALGDQDWTSRIVERLHIERRSRWFAVAIMDGPRIKDWTVLYVESPHEDHPAFPTHYDLIESYALPVLRSCLGSDVFAEV